MTSIPDMQITLSIFGNLKNVFGCVRRNIDLAEDGSLEAVFEWIGTEFGNLLPDTVWNKKVKRFRGSIIVMVNGERTGGLNRLSTGDHVQIVKLGIGG